MRGVRRVPSIALALSLLAAGASADSWRPCPDRRISSPSGKHYLVLRAEKGVRGAGEFDLVRRRDGAPALPDAERWKDSKEPGPPIDRDPEDAVLASGRLRQLPVDVHVLDRGPAAVLFDRWDGNCDGTVLALLGGTGDLRWSLTLKDLFADATLRKFGRSTSTIHWCRFWWVDEERWTIVLVGGLKGIYLEVSLVDGTRKPVDATVLLGRVVVGPAMERERVLELAAEDLPEGLAPLAKRVAEDPKEPPGIRLRAAAALKAAGVEIDMIAVFAEAAKAGQPPDLREYAIDRCAAVLGERAIPILRDALRAPGEPASMILREAMKGFALLGGKAVPALVEALKDGTAPADFRCRAAQVLGKLRSPAAMNDLLDSVGGECLPLAEAALDAAIETGGPELRKGLLTLLSKGSPMDGRICTWVGAHPAPDSLEPLLLAMERTKEDAPERARFRDSLNAVTGTDFGLDPAAWRRGLAPK